VPRKPKSSSAYKIRRKLPDPLRERKDGRATLPRRQMANPARTAAEHRRPTDPAALRDEQLAIASIEAVAPEEAQPFLKWVGGKAFIHIEHNNHEITN
jgi:hypothetical protein